MTAMNESTRAIIGWLRGDRVLFIETREIANGDDTQFGDDQLYEWTYDVVTNSGPFLTEEMLRDMGADMEALSRVRAELPEGWAEAVDWPHVRMALLGQEVTG